MKRVVKARCHHLWTEFPVCSINLINHSYAANRNLSTNDEEIHKSQYLNNSFWIPEVNYTTHAHWSFLFLWIFCPFFFEERLQTSQKVDFATLSTLCLVSVFVQTQMSVSQIESKTRLFGIDRSGCTCACSKKRHCDTQTQKTEWEATAAALTACVSVCTASCCLQSAGRACSRQQGGAARWLTGCRRGADGSTALTGGATTIAQLNPTVVTFWGRFVFTK